MEHRLIFYRPHVQEVSSGLSEPINNRLAFIQSLTEKRANFNEKNILLPAADNAISLARDPQKLENQLNRTFGIDLLHNLNATTVFYRGPLLTAKSALSSKLHANNAVHNPVMEMIDTIITPLPLDGPEPQHRYVQKKMNQGKDNAGWYDVNFAKIDADRALVQSLLGSYPELAILDEALANYSAQDRRRAIYSFAKNQAENNTDAAIMEMGKISLFLIASFAAVTTGIIALKNKRPLTAPLLWAAVAGLIGSPTLRRKLFSSEQQNMIEEINASINDPAFKKEAQTYGISGKSWKDYVQNVMENPVQTKNLIKDLNNNRADGPELETRIQDYINDTMPNGDPEARQNLTRMIYDRKFDAFAYRMMGVSAKGAQEVVLDYINKGAAQLNNVATQTMQQI